MSLINQMLRDLEQRNTPKAAAATPKLEPRPAPNTRRRRHWIWLISLMVALPLVYVWRQTQPSRAAPPSVALPTVELPAKAEQVASPPTTDSPRQPPPPETPIVSTTGSQPANTRTAQPHPADKTSAPKTPPSRKKAQARRSRTASALKPAKAQTPAQQADALYRRAQASHTTSAIEAHLRDALQLKPKHLGARTLLLQTLLKTHASPEDVADFVEESLRLFPDNLLFVKTRAHLYVQQKNFAAATSMLEQVDADTVDDTAYLSLLAAGYQQQQRFSQAERIYLRLTQRQPDKAEHWLGLAICQEKSNQSQAAAQAYQQALDKNTLNADVVNYIKQRLSALH